MDVRRRTAEADFCLKRACRVLVGHLLYAREFLPAPIPAPPLSASCTLPYSSARCEVLFQEDKASARAGVGRARSRIAREAMTSMMLLLESLGGAAPASGGKGGVLGESMECEDGDESEEGAEQGETGEVMSGAQRLLILIGTSVMRPKEAVELRIFDDESPNTSTAASDVFKRASAGGRQLVRKLISIEMEAREQRMSKKHKLFLLVSRPATQDPPDGFLPKRNFKLHTKRATHRVLNVRLTDQQIAVVDDASSPLEEGSPYSGEREMLWYQYAGKKHIRKLSPGYWRGFLGFPSSSKGGQG